MTLRLEKVLLDTNKIELLCKENNITNKELSLRIGKSEKFIRSLCKNNYPLYMPLVNLIACALNANVNDIVMLPSECKENKETLLSEAKIVDYEKINELIKDCEVLRDDLTQTLSHFIVVVDKIEDLLGARKNGE